MRPRDRFDRPRRHLRVLNLAGIFTPSGEGPQPPSPRDLTQPRGLPPPQSPGVGGLGPHSGLTQVCRRDTSGVRPRWVTVTLISDFLDADGKAVGSETLVTAFNFPGQTIAMVGGSVVKGRAQVASIESELIIEPADNNVSKVDLGSVEGTNLRQKGDDWISDFTVTNPSNQDLKSPDVAVVCRDASGAIKGGGVDFPDVVPAEGETVVSPFLLVEGDPAECTAYISDPL